MRVCWCISGSLLGVFEDDRTYPFEANAPSRCGYRCRTPQTVLSGSNPGRVPRLIIHRSGDYWQKSVDVPQAYWSRHFEVRTATDRAGRVRKLPADLSRAAYIGMGFRN